MKKTFQIGMVTLVLSMGLLLLCEQGSLWSQETQDQPAQVTSKGKAGKNLQILAYDDIKQLQNSMRTISKSLGTDCKFCHLMTDFPKDDPKLHKGKAREMMLMVNEINEKFFKDSDKKITCYTCHQGHKEPITTLEEALKIQKETKQP